VKVGRQIYVSGTTDASPTGAALAPNDAYAQTLGIFRKIDEALQEVNASLADVVRTRMFVVRVKDNYPHVARAHKELLGKTMPAATMVEVAGLVNPELLVEIEVDAIEGLSRASFGARPRIVEASFEPGSDLARMLETVDLPLPSEGSRVRMLKAYAGGELAGCVGYERYDESAVLHSLVVNPDAKGEGVGRALIESLLARLRDVGVKQVYLVTTDTAQYFGYFGFAAVEKSAVDPAVLACPEFAAFEADTVTYMRFKIR
jgi:enamine deaminase RidA (YjgF/YER057c/UK114 family)/predicted GNAT family acetyltransferase